MRIGLGEVVRASRSVLRLSLIGFDHRRTLILMIPLKTLRNSGLKDIMLELLESSRYIWNPECRGDRGDHGMMVSVGPMDQAALGREIMGAERALVGVDVSAAMGIVVDQSTVEGVRAVVDLA